jgi:outer membrane biogenesis lipoprotein LolB
MHPRHLAAAAFAAVLNGCATVPPPPAPAELSGPGAFDLSARISVRQGDKLDIAKLRWTHGASFDLWVISSPIGTELARIEREGEAVVLSRAGETPMTAPSFAAISESMLGVALEPGELAQWLQGAAPAPGGAWRVEVDERDAGGSVRRLTAFHANTVVRIVIDSFRHAPQ